MFLNLLKKGESHPRSFVKAVSWRILGSIDTFVLTLLISHSFKLAGSVASVETITKIVLFYFHERLWTVIPWGQPKVRALAEAVPGAADGDLVPAPVLFSSQD